MKQISKIIPSSMIRMGHLLTRQPLPAGSLEYLDPFLLLHHTGPFDFPPANAGLPFAPHPHKGFETVTFIFDGAVEHKDSTGIESIIETGGVQWMTAGKGIVHSENLPREMKHHGGTVEYIQLWINLPAAMKSLPARYQGIQKAEVPVISQGDSGSFFSLYAGKWEDTNGPAESVTGIEACVYSVESGDEVAIDVPTGRTILFYPLNGRFDVNGTEIKAHHMPVFSTGSEKVSIRALEKGRFLWCTGEPIGEPVVSHGPFVMNTETEILEAMRDFQKGKMGILFD
jgi:quercetin 2,3-dioxygenase